MGSTPWVPDRAGAGSAGAAGSRGFEKGGEKRNVFVSFEMGDEAQVRLLAYQAKDDKFEFTFRDYSVKEPFDEKWKTQVREKLHLVSAVMVAIGAKTHESGAVDWEIKEAYDQEKLVFGVRLYRDRGDKVPPAIQADAKIVNWTAKEISGALSQ